MSNGNALWHRFCIMCKKAKSEVDFKNANIKTCVSCAENRKESDRKYKNSHWYINIIAANKKKDTIKGQYDEKKHIDKDFLLNKLAEQEGKCFYCNVDMTTISSRKIMPTKLTVERMNNSLGHYKHNCVLACHKCNVFRGNRYTFREFLRYTGKLSEIREPYDADCIPGLFNLDK